MRITRSAERATVLFLPLCRPNASFLLFCLKFASIFSFSISETREKEIHPFQSGAGSALINQTESWSGVQIQLMDRFKRKGDAVKADCRRESRSTRSDTLHPEFLEMRQEGTARSRDEMSRPYETESLASRLHFNTWRGGDTRFSTTFLGFRASCLLGSVALPRLN